MAIYPLFSAHLPFMYFLEVIEKLDVMLGFPACNAVYNGAHA